jgi:hypothetical protein
MFAETSSRVVRERENGHYCELHAKGWDLRMHPIEYEATGAGRRDRADQSR